MLDFATDPQLASATDPQLAFDVGNADAPHTIFITTDPAVNRLTLSVATTADVTVRGGRPVPPREATRATQTLIYVDLSALDMSDAEFRALTLGAPDGWTIAAYAETRKLCLAPDADGALRAGARLLSTIDRLTIANPPSGASAQLVATYYRVPPITLGNLGVVSDFQVLLQPAPHAGGDLHEAIRAQVGQPFVIASTDLYPNVENSLSLVLSPGSRPRGARATRRTAFSLTFVYADRWPGYGALCTRREARSIAVTPGPGAEEWVITRGGELESPAWLLQPPPGELLGNPDTGTVELRIGRLVSSLAGGPTLALLSYTGVEGYKDGSYAILLQKLPHVGISRLEVTPNPVVLRGGVAEVVVSWEVENAGTLNLAPLFEPVTGRTSARATIRDTTQFTLTADGIERASSGNQAVRNVTAVVLPVINSFTASPAPVWDGDFPRSVRLAWNVNTGGSVSLRSSVESDPLSTGLPAVGQLDVTIDEPQMFTLVPDQGPAGADVRRSLVVSAFRPTFATTPLNAPASAIAIAPNAGYVVVADAAGSVTPLDSVVYQPLTEPLQTGARPSAIAFAPDGSQLFVANAGAGTVSVFDVSAIDDWPSFAFTPRQTVRVGGSPRAVALSPDGAWLYVALDNGSAAGALVYARRDSGGAIGTTSSITIGRAPRGLAVSGSGAQLYVPNSADDTLSVIGRSSGGRHQLVKTLLGLASRPLDVAVSADDAVLLVACEGSSTVFAIDAEYPDSAPRKPLTVGPRPQQLALVPGGAYALAACAGGGVTLLNVGRRPNTCSVLEQSLPAGTQPLSVAVSPQAGLALIGEGGSAQLGVLTLAEYAQQQTPTAVADGVNSVSVTPDGAQALIWHDALIDVGGIGRSTGYGVYELASHTVTEQSEGTPFVELLPVPRRGADSIYSITKDATAVQVLSSDDHQPRFEIDLPGDAGAPIALASSGDGALLGVLCRRGELFTVAPYAVDLAGDDARSLGTVRAFTASGATDAFLTAAPDGRRLYAVCSADGQLWVADRRGSGFAFGSRPVTVPQGTASVALSPDGRRLFLLSQGGINNALTVYATSDGSVRTVLLPDVGSIALNGITVSPDGTRLFAADGLRAGIRVFDAASLRLVQTISWTSQVRVPWGVASLPDGSQVFTANAGSGNIAAAQQVQPGVRQPA